MMRKNSTGKKAAPKPVMNHVKLKSSAAKAADEAASEARLAASRARAAMEAARAFAEVHYSPNAKSRLATPGPSPSGPSLETAAAAIRASPSAPTLRSPGAPAFTPTRGPPGL